jgi:hypothetical protein
LWARLPTFRTGINEGITQSLRMCVLSTYPPTDVTASHASIDLQNGINAQSALHASRKTSQVVHQQVVHQQNKARRPWRLAPQASLRCFRCMRDVRNHPASGLTGCLCTLTAAQGVCSRCPEATFPGDGKVALDSLICNFLGRRQRAEDQSVAHHHHVRGRRLCRRSTAL